MKEIITVPASVREHIQQNAANIRATSPPANLPATVQREVGRALELFRQEQGPQASLVMAKAMAMLAQIEPELFALIVAGCAGHSTLTIREEETYNQPAQRLAGYVGPFPRFIDQPTTVTRTRTKTFKFS